MVVPVIILNNGGWDCGYNKHFSFTPDMLPCGNTTEEKRLFEKPLGVVKNRKGVN